MRGQCPGSLVTFEFSLWVENKSTFWGNLGSAQQLGCFCPNVCPWRFVLHHGWKLEAFLLLLFRNNQGLILSSSRGQLQALTCQSTSCWSCFSLLFQDGDPKINQQCPLFSHTELCTVFLRSPPPLELIVPQPPQLEERPGRQSEEDQAPPLRPERLRPTAKYKDCSE
jgi:hypothetical protein